MARPTKWRRVANIPQVQCFIPAKDSGGRPQNVLKVEELEAIRLKDLEGLEQSECAAKMEVSRPTFQRILLSAREKIADSLVNGKAIQIEGGNFTLSVCPMKCLHCGHEWTESYECLEAVLQDEYTCPACGSPQVYCSAGFKGKFCRGHCHRHGRRRRGGKS
ncbi:MAG: DUF134 domain-containing protein [Firmicutes bacterium]|nr:DUF134 domain-containing protein [Bacillota bacterium]